MDWAKYTKLKIKNIITNPVEWKTKSNQNKKKQKTKHNNNKKTTMKVTT